MRIILRVAVVVLMVIGGAGALSAQVGLRSDAHLPPVDVLPAFLTESVDLTGKYAPEIAVLPPVLVARPLLGLYKYEDLAFFCKAEVQIERVVRFPVKFRLGSVEYVDMLEGK